MSEAGDLRKRIETVTGKPLNGPKGPEWLKLINDTLGVLLTRLPNRK
ncbi:hypothetical protein AGMMS50212_10090 [Spirochaetia bacterium]|nr:hypothetical protein AGMMS50212_10090 [Spirochaetia bacterium]